MQRSVRHGKVVVYSSLDDKSLYVLVRHAALQVEHTGPICRHYRAATACSFNTGFHGCTERRDERREHTENTFPNRMTAWDTWKLWTFDSTRPACLDLQDSSARPYRTQSDVLRFTSRIPRWPTELTHSHPWSLSVTRVIADDSFQACILRYRCGPFEYGTTL